MRKLLLFTAALLCATSMRAEISPGQKLVREGNVYVLTDDKTYTLTGQAVR